ncbi:DUF2771 family protein [Actinosynnema sp. NPDC020468]|uniref:DUF2771 family protein n=1 Tax=Actinosynnema sp. NPDC020468 TaxID=3154488 RepID=UPI0033E6B541
MRRLLPVLVLLLAGCSAPAPPAVTFYADGHAVDATPTLYCDVKSENCAEDAAAETTLAVRPGYPVQISVPGDVADSAWAVNVLYASEGRQQVMRSPVFTPAEVKHAYTLTLPGKSDQVVRVEVQQFGTRIESNGDGVDFVARGIWVLNAG